MLTLITMINGWHLTIEQILYVLSGKSVRGVCRLLFLYSPFLQTKRVHKWYKNGDQSYVIKKKKIQAIAMLVNITILYN